jgi:hypothetical protein
MSRKNTSEKRKQRTMKPNYIRNIHPSASSAVKGRTIDPNKRNEALISIEKLNKAKKKESNKNKNKKSEVK